MFTHYVDIMIRMPEVSRDLHARLIMLVHASNGTGNKLAVTWPDWKPALGEFGFLCRVFGEQEKLEQFLISLKPLLDREMVRVYPIALVPAVTQRVVFARDRRYDKFGPSAFNRLAKRAAQRGTTFNPKECADLKLHSLKIQSSSTSQEFHLFVRREAAATDRQGGHEYGLGIALPDF